MLEAERQVLYDFRERARLLRAVLGLTGWQQFEQRQQGTLAAEVQAQADSADLYAAYAALQYLERAIFQAKGTMRRASLSSSWSCRAWKAKSLLNKPICLTAG